MSAQPRKKKVTPRQREAKLTAEEKAVKRYQDAKKSIEQFQAQANAQLNVLRGAALALRQVLAEDYPERLKELEPDFKPPETQKEE